MGPSMSISANDEKGVGLEEEAWNFHLGTQSLNIYTVSLALSTTLPSDTKHCIDNEFLLCASVSPARPRVGPCLSPASGRVLVWSLQSFVELN